MSGDPRDEMWYETLYDNEGNPVRRIVEHSPIKENSSGFTTYDTSHGHCGLCGRLSCNGGCFK